MISWRRVLIVSIAVEIACALAFWITAAIGLWGLALFGLLGPYAEIFYSTSWSIYWGTTFVSAAMPFVVALAAWRYFRIVRNSKQDIAEFS